MSNADDFNAALEEAEQSILRQQVKKAAAGTPMQHMFGQTDTYDRVHGVIGGMVLRRNNAVKAIAAPKDGEYG